MIQQQSITHNARLASDEKNIWSVDEAIKIYQQPFNDLLFQAQQIHRKNFDPNKIQMSRLLSIKTGGCAEDCQYCNQSASYDTGLKASKLLEIESVINEAKQAKLSGSTRYCMGAAWSAPKQRDMEKLTSMIRGVKALGLQTCMTLGQLSYEDAQQLKQAGLDYYNHNIDTSPDYYKKIISTRCFEDRLETLENVRQAGMNVCAGGIVGMGEEKQDRIQMLVILANLQSPPESVPINMLVPIKGTPLENIDKLDNFEFIRTIATARILMPTSYVRLSAGRLEMNEEMQALCFFAGANSIFAGDKLLTAENPEQDTDANLFNKLGIQAELNS